MSSFKELKVQKQLVTQEKIEVAENPSFMMEARRKELERRQSQKEELTPVVKEKRKFSLFPYHHRSESRAVSAVLPPSEGPPPSKATVSLSKPSSSPSNGWFISGLKGFFGPRQLPTAYSSPTPQHSTKSTKTTTTTVVVNNRNFPSDDSDVGFSSPVQVPCEAKIEREMRTDNNIREIASGRRRNT